MPPVDFPLTTGNESGKTKLPVVIELVSPDNKGLSFEVTASGFHGTDPVVSQTADSSFDPGYAHILTLFLDAACRGVTSGPCVTPITPLVTDLPPYVPGQLFLPDAGADTGGDGAGSPDVIADARAGGDAAADQPVAAPEAGAEVAAEAPRALDVQPSGSLDASADVWPEVAVQQDAVRDLPLLDDTPICISPGCTQGGDAGLDSFADALETLDGRRDAPPEAQRSLDVPPDLSFPRDLPADAPLDAPSDLVPSPDAAPDLAGVDGASGCTLPLVSCPGGCVNSQSSIGNCGGCGLACGAQNGTPACSASVCSMSSCASGYFDCSVDENASRDGCETNGNTDSANCGRCGNACSSKVCRNQTCLATAYYGNRGSGSTTSPFSNDFLAGIQVYIPNPSTVTGLGAVLYTATLSCNMYLGLYKDVAGNPGALVATVNAPALVAPGGKELTVDPPVDVLAGTYWILGVWDQLATFASNSTTNVTWVFSSYAFAALPATAPTSMTAIPLPPPNLYVIVAQ